jgi:hypothetical protein
MWEKEEKEMVSVIKDRLEKVADIMSVRCLEHGELYYDGCTHGLHKCPFAVKNCMEVTSDMWKHYLTDKGDYQIKPMGT